jgi:hypothetical protein
VIDTHETVRIRLTVTDMPGASDTDELVLVPANRTPTLDVQTRGRKNARGGYLLGRPVTIEAEGHDDLDRDELTYEAAWFPPPGVSASPGFATVDEHSWTLTPDALGVWEVEVTVSDGVAPAPGTASVRVPITVDEDLPPCIVATSPPAITGGRYVIAHDEAPRRFGVELVTDELDPWPLPPDDLGCSRRRRSAGSCGRRAARASRSPGCRSPSCSSILRPGRRARSWSCASRRSIAFRGRCRATTTRRSAPIPPATTARGA